MHYSDTDETDEDAKEKRPTPNCEVTENMVCVRFFEWSVKKKNSFLKSVSHVIR